MPVGERKLATVLFADLVGSTELAGDQDPERVRALLDRFYDSMAAEIGRAGGTVEKFAGDAVMAAFGAPAAHEDDAERALHVALAMQRRLGELFGDRLALRIGVNTGAAPRVRRPSCPASAWRVGCASVVDSDGELSEGADGEVGEPLRDVLEAVRPRYRDADDAGGSRIGELREGGRDGRRLKNTVSTVRKSHSMMVAACRRRNSFQLKSSRRGAGSIASRWAELVSAQTARLRRPRSGWHKSTEAWALAAVSSRRRATAPDLVLQSTQRAEGVVVVVRVVRL